MSNSTSPKPNSKPKQGLVHEKKLTFDKVVLRYSQPHHGDFLASVMQKLQQPDATPSDLIFGISQDVDELERAEDEKEEAKKAAEELMKNGKVAPRLLLNALSDAVEEMEREDKQSKTNSSSRSKSSKKNSWSEGESSKKNSSSRRKSSKKKSSWADKQAKERELKGDNWKEKKGSFEERKAAYRAEQDRQRDILVKKVEEELSKP